MIQVEILTFLYSFVLIRLLASSYLVKDFCFLNLLTYLNSPSLRLRVPPREQQVRQPLVLSNCVIRTHLNSKKLVMFPKKSLENYLNYASLIVAKSSQHVITSLIVRRNSQFK